MEILDDSVGNGSPFLGNFCSDYLATKSIAEPALFHPAARTVTDTEVGKANYATDVICKEANVFLIRERANAYMMPRNLGLR